MATKTTVVLIDDLDGSEATDTINFGLDGVDFEIDLNDEHAGQIREALSMWIGHARKIGGRARRGTASRIPAPAANKTGITAEDRAAMQRWAPSNGFKAPADRGRIAEPLREAWVAAGRPSF